MIGDSRIGFCKGIGEIKDELEIRRLKITY
jgi:hypothetical protein